MQRKAEQDSGTGAVAARQCDVAIVGMAARFAGAPDLSTFWDNILAKVDAVKDASDRWAAPFFDPASSDNARIYTRKGGFLGDSIDFDPAEFGVMPATVAAGDSDHFLALAATSAALADAGYAERPFDRESTGIILGHGTYVNRGYNTLLHHGQIIDQTLALLRDLHPEIDEASESTFRRALKESLPEFSSTTIPSLVPNVITGRISNRLDLRGPNYIVDAACASSLLAVELAVRELTSSRCSMMLTGGIHTSTPPQLYMMFCQLNALSRHQLRPFDQTADGTLLGEGVGILVLKRRADAERAGDRIYALIQGTGTASDGKALGLLTPRQEGQVLALQRAYVHSGIDPATIDLVEAHGTGTPVGDRTEVESLRSIYSDSSDGPRRALGSVKSMIGHCISAAGAAGLIKTTLALHDRIVPPTLCESVNQDLALGDASFYINNETRPWIMDPSHGPRRAAVNAFGFGGINAHVVLEEYRGGGDKIETQTLRSWPTEVLFISAPSRGALIACVDQIVRLLADDPSIPLSTFARWLSSQPYEDFRLAIVCSTVSALQSQLADVLGAFKRSPEAIPRTRDVFFGECGSAKPGGIAFLYPGESSQHRNMLMDLCVRMPPVRAWFDLLDEVFHDTDTNPPSRAIFPPPTCLTADEDQTLRTQLFAFVTGSAAVFTASLALHEVLRGCGINPDAMLGHSTGEGAALVASGIFRYPDRNALVASMRRFYGTCRELDRSGQIPKGQMISVGAINETSLAQILEATGGRAHLALDNCPNQKVVFCDTEEAKELVERIERAGGLCTSMPLDRAYHTAHFIQLRETIGTLYDDTEIGAANVPVYSCATAEEFPRDATSIRELATRQWFSTVRFRETVLRLYEEGIRTFVEVGPGNTLTSFTRDILGQRPHLALASAPQGKPGVSQLQRLLAQLFVRGTQVNLAPLFAHRNVPVYDPSARDAGASGRPPRPSLELTMPRMTATPKAMESIRGILGRSAITIPAAQTTAAGVQRADEIPTVSTASLDEDARLAVLQTHFGLMRDFLGSQMRVMETAMADTPIATPPSPAGHDHETTSSPDSREMDHSFAQSWPMLGTIVESANRHLVCERRFNTTTDPWLLDHALGGATGASGKTHALPVVPFTVSMEIIAEAALCLAGKDFRVAELRTLRGYRWLALDRDHVTVLISAAMLNSDPQRAEVEVRIHLKPEGASEQQALVFEGIVGLASRFEPPPSPALALEDLSPSHYTAEMLYGAFQKKHGRYAPMFHGPNFQVVKTIRGWNEQGIEGVVEINDKRAFVRGIDDPTFQVDPVLLDAAGQILGYWVAERFGVDLTFFPFNVRSYRQYGPPPCLGQHIVCRAIIGLEDEADPAHLPCFEFVGDNGLVITRRDASSPIGETAPDAFDYCRLTPPTAFLEAKFELLDEQGLVLARIDGWRDRYFSISHRHYLFHLRPRSEYFSTAWPHDAGVCRRIDPVPYPYLEEGWQIWKRALAHLVLGARERAYWDALDVGSERRTEWLLGRLVAKEAVREWVEQKHGLDLPVADIEIARGEMGEPLVRIPVLPDVAPAVSISHSKGVVAAIASERGDLAGLDIECLRGIDHQAFASIAFGDAEQHLINTCAGSDRDRVLLSMWCAKEAASKVHGKGLAGTPMNWTVDGYSTDGMAARVTCGLERYAVALDIWDGTVRAIARSEHLKEPSRLESAEGLAR